MSLLITSLFLRRLTGCPVGAALGLLALGPVSAQTAPTLTNTGTTLMVGNGATLYVAGSVQQASGSTLTNAGTVQLTGDLTNAGTLTSPGLLFFSGSQDQTFTPGPATVASLTVGNTGATGANRLLLPTDLTITNLLTLSQGLIRTQGSATLLLDGGRVVGEAAGQYVQGRLQVARDAVNASTGSVDFTSGFVLNPNGKDLGAVIVTRTAGLRQAGVSYGQNLSGTNKGIDRVWQVVAGQQPSAAAPASVTVSWVADDDNGFNPATPAQLWRADQAGGPWATQGQPASASARSFTTNVAQLGTFTLSNTSAPLPVTLVSFTAQRQGADGLLHWATASELNNAYFVVESSTDGITFQRLGQVAEAGTSSQAHSYQYVDANLARYATGQVYYRLRQVDLDGTGTYSPLRTVQVLAAEGLAIAAYPNPSATSQPVILSLRTDQAGPAELLLTDVLGRPVGQQQLVLPTGTTTVPLPEGGQLAPGVYLLRLRQGQQQQTLKLVRQ